FPEGRPVAERAVPRPSPGPWGSRRERVRASQPLSNAGGARACGAPPRRSRPSARGLSLRPSARLLEMRAFDEVNAALPDPGVVVPDPARAFHVRRALADLLDIVTGKDHELAFDLRARARDQV